MSQLIAGTSAVSMDEPCLGVSELNLQSPGSRGWRRYQVIRVVRNDQPAEMRRDLGPMTSFTVEEFRIPGGVVEETTGRIYIEHTVGELLDIAEYLRLGDFERPQLQPDDLVKRYHDNIERQQAQAVNRSAFGPLAKIQRG